jgi:hypothetical protein
MREIKSIGVFQTSLVFGLVNFVLGALAALVMAIAPVMPMMHEHQGMVIMIPFSYAIGAFLVSAVLYVTYNLAAKLVGGIQIELTASADAEERADAAGFVRPRPARPTSAARRRRGG